MLRRLIKPHTIAMAALLVLPGLAAADQLETSFEFSDDTGSFTLGEEPFTVTFEGGIAQSTGNFDLYHDGFFSWMIDTGDTGTITFETPAQSIIGFIRNESDTVSSTFTLLDEDGNVITSVEGDHVDWVEVNVDVGDKAAPIASITYENTGSAGWAVLDSFTYCAAEGGDGGLDDPIPDPIPVSDISIQLEEVASGLTAPNWATWSRVDNPAAQRRLFVVDQPGQLYAINLASGEMLLFLDVSDRLVDLGAFGDETFDERGFLGFDFHPNYRNNGLLYTYTSEPADEPADFTVEAEVIDHHSVITEWQVPDPTSALSVVDPDSARVLMRVEQPQFNHDAGALNFGRDGMLYIPFGDGGGADDEGDGHGETGNGQNPSTVLGSVLRIDPLGSDSDNGQYGIPDDNPFLDDDTIPDETWAYGFRNPFRFSVDRGDGKIIIADVGQNDIEEVNVLQRGRNYGWNLKEGTFCFDGNGEDPGFVTDCEPDQVPEDLVDPIAQYDHDEGIAIIGGLIFRGSSVPELQGRYVFGEFAQTFANDGRLFVFSPGTGIEELLPGGSPLGMFLLGMGEDVRGDIYVLTNTTGTPFGDTGKVWRIVADDE